MVTICVSEKMKYLATARAMLVGYLAVGVVLSTIVTDFFNNLRDTTNHRGSVRSFLLPFSIPVSLLTLLHQTLYVSACAACSFCIPPASAIRHLRRIS